MVAVAHTAATYLAPSRTKDSRWLRLGAGRAASRPSCTPTFGSLVPLPICSARRAIGGKPLIVTRACQLPRAERISTTTPVVSQSAVPVCEAATPADGGFCSKLRRASSSIAAVGLLAWAGFSGGVQAARAAETPTAPAAAVVAASGSSPARPAEQGVAISATPEVIATVAQYDGAVESAPAAIDTGDTAFMITSTALVLAMSVPGLAYFYGGLVGRKSVLSIFMGCFSLVCIMTLLFMTVGYSMAFDTGNPVVGGLGKSFLQGVTASSVEGTIPEPLWFCFQNTFACITPGIIIGAFAERLKFSVMILFSVLWALTTYFPFAHMVWGGGYFGELGLLDFAGGIVVHLTAGAAALMAAIMAGKRKGFVPGEEYKPPHNLPMVIAGTAILWIGWYGFNGGSAVAASGGAAMALIATQVAASAGAMTWAALDWLGSSKKPTALGACCGAVAGLVCITPSAGFVSPVGALISGVLAGVICRWASTSLKKMLGYDDSLDVVGVHGVGGLLGNQLCAIFGATQFGGTETVASVWDQFLLHGYGSLVAIVWSMAATFVILKTLSWTMGGLTVTPEEEDDIDSASFGEKAYPAFAVQ
mmetsp:Transcript_186/g.609  ORF Transcript_186/g.609 Transcript_186/m.609 type:complete len:590 (-) Transcript_186:118-1887(-)